MQSALNQFQENITRVRSLGSLYKRIRNQTTSILDLSDILRAELVLGVSALDQYIHEITRIGMIEAYKNNRNQTDAFKKFDCSLENIIQSHQDPSTITWLDNEIRKKHGWLAFEQPDKIADAIRLISDVKLWEEVSVLINKNPQDTKDKLKEIVIRRNKIAHEADIDHSHPNTLWPIDEKYVDESINFIEQIVNAIHNVIK
ncbi:hypothetical protein Mtc_1986 [Methanocella conradii HZ254]|uniref:RiboL-PSP-HEPN domain-containing protein n=1 Tax=Methanocella conradii (strain DSM 24694 / JCM 17849 / CGMCC 1.5162 / HZ254) TaxID=1041930 RepID=H8I679_METCZ|nr:HEPN domain-containing protein [Methanocella conradii]AFD00726.1 hypothetical protein Mtc_1986 [Methanocella conradii HZ254]